MPRSRGVRTSQANQTRAALVNAARRLFAAKGFHATGTHEIVNEAQVSRGALQHHFPRKEDLFLAVFHAVEQDMLAASDVSPESRPGDRWLQLRSNINAFLRAATTPEVQRIILIDGPAVLGWAAWRCLETHYGLGVITLAVEDGVRAGSIRKQPAAPLAHMILSMIDEAALLVANSQDPDRAIAEAQVALETLLASLN